MTEKRYVSLLKREVNKMRNLIKNLKNFETFGDIIKYGMFKDKVHTMVSVPKTRINYQNFVPINMFSISKEKNCSSK